MKYFHILLLSLSLIANSQGAYAIGKFSFGIFGKNQNKTQTTENPGIDNKSEVKKKNPKKKRGFRKAPLVLSLLSMAGLAVGAATAFGVARYQEDPATMMAHVANVVSDDPFYLPAIPDDPDELILENVQGPINYYLKTQHEGVNVHHWIGDGWQETEYREDGTVKDYYVRSGSIAFNRYQNDTALVSPADHRKQQNQLLKGTSDVGFYDEGESIEFSDVLFVGEDANFLKHKGTEPIRLGVALAHNTTSKIHSIIDPSITPKKQGASTLSMQLAKNLYPDEVENDGTIAYKWRQMTVAKQLEKKFSKQELYEIYVNTSYFSHDRPGVEQAARYYFDKTVEQLSLGQKLQLVAALRDPSPGVSAPFDELNTRYSKFYLDRMVDYRYLEKDSDLYNSVLEYLDSEIEKAQFKRRVNRNNIRYGSNTKRATYIRAALQEEVERLAEGNHKFQEAIQRGFLKIYTTYDASLENRINLKKYADRIGASRASYAVVGEEGRIVALGRYGEHGDPESPKAIGSVVKLLIYGVVLDAKLNDPAFAEIIPSIEDLKENFKASDSEYAINLANTVGKKRVIQPLLAAGINLPNYNDYALTNLLEAGSLELSAIDAARVSQALLGGGVLEVPETNYVVAVEDLQATSYANKYLYLQEPDSSKKYRLINNNSSQVLNSFAVANVEEAGGTATNSRIKGYKTALKTGTHSHGGDGYDKNIGVKCGGYADPYGIYIEFGNNNIHRSVRAVGSYACNALSEISSQILPTF